MTKLYLVLHSVEGLENNSPEGVFFADESDAIFTATGRQMDLLTPSIGENFRESYEECGEESPHDGRGTHPMVAIYTGSLGSAFHAVRLFHTTFGQPAPSQPTMLTAERVKARADWSAEEVQEFRDATTLTEQVDSALDRIYFALGDLVEMGVDPSPLFDFVQGANMAKLWADGLPHFRKDGKIIKPDGWTAPDVAIEAEVQRQIDVGGVL